MKMAHLLQIPGLRRMEKNIISKIMVPFILAGSLMKIIGTISITMVRLQPISGSNSITLILTESGILQKNTIPLAGKKIMSDGGGKIRMVHILHRNGEKSKMNGTIFLIPATWLPDGSPLMGSGTILTPPVL